MSELLVCPVCKKPFYLLSLRPITNADLIRAMSDEELARWISEITYCGACKDLHGFKLCDLAPSWNCEKSYLEWLKQEADES